MQLNRKVQLPVADAPHEKESHPPVAEQIVYKEHWKTQSSSQSEIMLTVSRCVR